MFSERLTDNFHIFFWESNAGSFIRYNASKEAIFWLEMLHWTATHSNVITISTTTVQSSQNFVASTIHSRIFIRKPVGPLITSGRVDICASQSNIVTIMALTFQSNHNSWTTALVRIFFRKEGCKPSSTWKQKRNFGEFEFCFFFQILTSGLFPYCNEQ